MVTVSPIRYAKYGYHGSALSKAVLLLAAEQLQELFPDVVNYFPAYEIVNDELRDYRFYQPDMLHPSQQAVDYIWQRFAELYLSHEAKSFIQEWKPVKEALSHRPFHPDSAGHDERVRRIPGRHQPDRYHPELDQVCQRHQSMRNGRNSPDAD